MRKRKKAERGIGASNENEDHGVIELLHDFLHVWCAREEMVRGRGGVQREEREDVYRGSDSGNGAFGGEYEQRSSWYGY